MDFEQLRTFLEVSRLRSFSRAAEKLSVTQPAVSAQIRSLETEVGARLFDRDGGKVTFTAAGRVFEPFAEHVLQCHTHIGVTISELHRSPRGEISISANEATSLYVLPAVFAAFKKQYTRVALKIVRADRARILEDVLNREVDFGVVSLPVKDARLTIERIHKDEVVLVTGSTHPLAGRDTVTVAEVLEHPLVMTKSGRQRDQLDDFFRAENANPKVAMEVESSELLKRLIGAGLGMGFLPRAVVAAEVAGGTLRAAKVEGLKVSRELALVFLREKTLSRAAHAFLEIATGQNRVAPPAPAKAARAR